MKCGQSGEDMAVMMRQGNRVCNSVCHTAKNPKCTCICGGRNHGGGNGREEMETTDKTLIVDGNIIPLARSLQIRSHSPTGFNWGYGGSGPSQTALAILLECTSREEALPFYQAYKRDVIAGIPIEQNILEINSKDVAQWLSEKAVR